ncbi:indolepyruvate ferredoxin oxidoreductase subunit alpha [Pelagibius sp. Alg239-R121]|uniref:indolepyruvate ferredoxin oxidoreductase subunit alpha n=1 Tax=Pelagibius sp. Alg239-R121 TaxID=2993448 RepID=UPI0024A74152|nr:indolepyruvate ferredoxin oxidoreductase subunit alpha [Pelagibius sp. Alg239-R121]
MAERSFVQEVQALRLGAGETFRGEGILAVTKALLESGVGYVGGYQGAPISHLMDVLADAKDILDELGVHFEASASEAAAAAMLSASMHYPIRGAATWKSTVGTNVASDALANLSSGGVTGGALIIVGEDYGEGSSIMQERSHAFAMKSQIWLLDPRPNAESIVKAVRDGFELSEASNTPVMLELRIRACHVHGSFETRDNVRPDFTLEQARNHPRRETDRIVLPPASFAHEQEKVTKRWPAAVEFIKSRKLNEFFDGDITDIGIVLQGGHYNGVIAALRQLGLADVYGKTRVPLYVMNVTYPLIDDEVVSFCADKRAVLMVEEGQPDHLEQAVSTILRRAGVTTPLHGKDFLPKAGEYTNKALIEGIRGFLDLQAEKPAALAGSKTAAPLPDDVANALNKAVPPRPAGFCTGCPERPIFSALTLAQQDVGERHIACDIGCHLFSILPPFNVGASTMGYGLGAASASGLNIGKGKRSISIMGDGGFWHNGLASGIGNAVFNQSDDVVLIVDNFYAAATGGQDILSSRASNRDRSTRHPIEDAVKGVGVTWVRRIDHTYDVGAMRRVIEEALTTDASGPKVVIASSECMLNRQRRERPIRRKALGEGQRVVAQKFGVDEDICTGDHACTRISGCPSLTLKETDDPLRDDPVAFVDNSCVACGHCGEVADAAVLCPSFYRADAVHNPTFWDRTLARLRKGVTAKLQQRRDAQRLQEPVGEQP